MEVWGGTPPAGPAQPFTHALIELPVIPAHRFAASYRFRDEWSDFQIHSGMADGPDLQSTFVRRAEQAGTRVTLVSPHDLFASIAGAIDSPAAGVGVTSEVIAAHPAIAKLASRGKQHPETAVALAPLGIAETGSVALAERDRADRLLGLLCRRQIVVLERRALVPALAGAMPSLAGWISDGRPYVTFVTGPSRTSDIERILTIGVHGPAELTVLLLQ